MKKRNIYPKNFIKQLREQRGWTLRDLEELTGWSNQTLSNLELSKADLTWSKILRLADVFQCHPLEITEGPGNAAIVKDDQERALLRTFRSLENGARREFTHMVEKLKAGHGHGGATPQKNGEKEEKK